jgi:hypothetical protein
MKTRTIKQVQYESCDECHLFETPDENGHISVPRGVFKIYTTVINSEGEEVPNPIKGRCGYLGIPVKLTDGCKRWFDR